MPFAPIAKKQLLSKPVRIEAKYNGVPQDNDCASPGNTPYFFDGFPRKRRTLNDDHIRLMIRKRHGVAPAGNPPWDRLAFLRTACSSFARINIPGQWVSPLTSNVHDDGLDAHSEYFLN